ncbi:MAG: PEGA domain-containing protein [Eubacterium sp.]|nr:PEGA domain-containing protein [Eubacterium sp.]
MHGRISQAAAVMAISALLVSGCTSQASNIGMAKNNEDGAVDTGFTVATVGSYDSADTAVVVSTDQQNKSVTFMNMGTGKQYTLYYDGTTYVKDKYEGPMTISQIRAGDVVDVNFLKGKRQIASMQLSPAAWVYDNVVNYDLGGVNKTASIGSTTYSLPDEVVVLSEGRRVEVMDIVAQDVVSVQGIDHKIYSINVERGHGYLRLKNDQPLIGGWIEVGNSVIREITEDMLLIVPEGDYQVFLSNNGASCTKNVTIERDKEVVLDVGDLEIAEDKTGRILFSVTPENAKVTINHKEVDISSAVELKYGIHQVHLEASGYDSLTKYIQVGSEYAKISFTLEESKEEENDISSVSQNDLEQEEPDLLTEEDKPKADSVSSNDIFSVSDNTLSASSSNKVYIDSPKGVEVYLDGNYIGIAPVSFKKKTGSHTITLRRSGYQTKSYTIYLYDDKEDITYSFTDLERENQGTSDNKVTSTSTTSSQTPSDDSNEPTVSGNDSDPSNSDDPNNSGGGTGNTDNSGDGTGGAGNGGDGTGDTGNGGDGTGDAGNSGDGTGDAGNGGDGAGDTGNGGDGAGDTGNGGDGAGNTGNSGNGTGDAGNNGDGTGGAGNSNGGTGDADNRNDDNSVGAETGGNANPGTTSSNSTESLSITNNMKGIVTNSVSTFNKVKQTGK